MQKTTIAVLAVLLLMLTLSTSLEEIPVEGGVNLNLISARDFSGDETAEMTKEDCDERGGTWVAVPVRME